MTIDIRGQDKLRGNIKTEAVKKAYSIHLESIVKSDIYNRTKVDEKVSEKIKDLNIQDEKSQSIK